ncbi:hypothetical protein GE09DRAFT_1135673 [Coniochaeta sp. 2T2.1]|nr:hypothetical protein GE09DRAFT_1135673 [Coniochaeta sp. 2T2.1]
MPLIQGFRIVGLKWNWYCTQLGVVMLAQSKIVGKLNNTSSFDIRTSPNCNEEQTKEANINDIRRLGLTMRKWREVLKAMIVPQNGFGECIIIRLSWAGKLEMHAWSSDLLQGNIDAAGSAESVHDASTRKTAAENSCSDSSQADIHWVIEGRYDDVSAKRSVFSTNAVASTRPRLPKNGALRGCRPIQTARVHVYHLCVCLASTAQGTSNQ